MTQLLQQTLGVTGGQKTNAEARQCDTTHNAFGKHGHQDGVRCGETEAHTKIMDDRDVHGWIEAALLSGMAGLEGQATFESGESKFSFARCLR